MERTYTRAFSGPVGVYADGTPHVPARGRYAPRNRVEDYFTACGSVVEGFPDRADFLRQIVRELKIRFYQPSSVKNYRNAIRSFLRWFGGIEAIVLVLRRQSVLVLLLEKA